MEAELDLTITVLTNPTTQRLAETCQQPLAFLTQVREDLRDCVSVPPALQPQLGGTGVGGSTSVGGGTVGITGPYSRSPCSWPSRHLHISPLGN